LAALLTFPVTAQAGCNSDVLAAIKAINTRAFKKVQVFKQGTKVKTLTGQFSPPDRYALQEAGFQYIRIGVDGWQLSAGGYSWQKTNDVELASTSPFVMVGSHRPAKGNFPANDDGRKPACPPNSPVVLAQARSSPDRR
jgi:hypothetical protein